MTIEQTIDPAEVAGLREGFKGQVLGPSDDGYDTYRRVWNAMIDKRPAVILRCADTDDVVQAVRFARERGLLVSVKGGGHNLAGIAVCDDGVMIDLSAMRGVSVDPDTSTAVVQGGATWTDFDGAAQQHGLATTGGHVGSTGVAGLTLGGGFGWLHGKHGLASDNLLSAEVVTAEGKVLRASEDENPDLFWGLRGGGGNFGVATSLTFAVHPVGESFVGAFMFPRARVAEVMEAYSDFVPTLPSDATTALMQVTAPEGVDLIPADLWNQQLAMLAVIYPGASVEEGDRVVEPIRALGPAAEMAMAAPYLGVQTLGGQMYEPGMSAYWKSGRLDSLGGSTRKAIIEAGEHARSIVIQLGGKIDERPQDATAFAHRGARFQFITAEQWLEPSETDAMIAGARKAWQTVEPHSSGAFVNFVAADDWDKRTADAYGAEHSRRLASIKKTYDPENFFRMNANITPAGGPGG